jgi:hypothetical protein
MRPFKEIFRVLLIRDQLMLGWKIMFFIVCGALVIGSMMLARINVRAADINGVVTSFRSEQTESGTINYLIVRLDSGAIVEAHAPGPLNFQPGKRVAVRMVRSNFFRLQKHEFIGYLDPAGKNTLGAGAGSTDGSNRH